MLDLALVFFQHLEALIELCLHILVVLLQVEVLLQLQIQLVINSLEPIDLGLLLLPFLLDLKLELLFHFYDDFLFLILGAGFHLIKLLLHLNQLAISLIVRKRHLLFELVIFKLKSFTVVLVLHNFGF